MSVYGAILYVYWDTADDKTEMSEMKMKVQWFKVRSKTDLEPA